MKTHGGAMSFAALRCALPALLCCAMAVMGDERVVDLRGPMQREAIETLNSLQGGLECWRVLCPPGCSLTCLAFHCPVWHPVMMVDGDGHIVLPFREWRPAKPDGWAMAMLPSAGFELTAGVHGECFLWFGPGNVTCRAERIYVVFRVLENWR